MEELQGILERFAGSGSRCRPAAGWMGRRIVKSLCGHCSGHSRFAEPAGAIWIRYIRKRCVCWKSFDIFVIAGYNRKG